MKKSFHQIIFVVVLIFFSHSVANACQCPAEPKLKDVFESSDAIIKGEVILVETLGLEIFAFINVEKSWKGVNEDKVLIKTDTGSCGVFFDVGETYYLWVDKSGKDYVTMPCREFGEEQVAFLDEKPTIELKSSNLELSENSNSSESIKTKPTEGKNKQNPRSDSVFIYVVTVISSVFIILSLIVGFLFWKHRRS